MPRRVGRALPALLELVGVELVGLLDDVGHDVVGDRDLLLDLARVDEDVLLGLVIDLDDVDLADGIDGTLPHALARGQQQRLLGKVELAREQLGDVVDVLAR